MKHDFIIKLDPRTKKNSQRLVKAGNRIIPMPSKQYKEYESSCGWFVPKNLNINEPINVKCIFYMATRRRVDLVNLLEAVDDILVHYNVVQDDNSKIIAAHDGSRVFYDKENPRTEVFIESLEE